MRPTGRGMRVQRPGVAAATMLLVVTCVVFNPSCIIADCSSALRLRGVIVARDTRQPPLGVVLGSRTFTGGAETFFQPGYASPSPDDGSFEFDVANDFFGCYSPPPPFPRPDRIELIVAGPDCKQSVFIDINEQTVVDIAFPNDVIELRDPVLVPPCPVETAP